MKRVYFEDNIIEEINRSAKGHIRCFLDLLDSVKIEDQVKKVIRESFLDQFNSHHRSVKMNIQNLIRNAD